MMMMMILTMMTMLSDGKESDGNVDNNDDYDYTDNSG